MHSVFKNIYNQNLNIYILVLAIFCHSSGVGRSTSMGGSLCEQAKNGLKYQRMLCHDESPLIDFVLVLVWSVVSSVWRSTVNVFPILKI